MTNKTMVSAPRKLLEQILYGCTFTLSSKQHEELRALLAAPAEDVRAVVDEPVYQVRSHGSCRWEDIGGESLEVCRSQAEEYETRTLYRHPQRPVVLPERLEIPEPQGAYVFRKGWNAYADEYQRLNK